MASASLIEVFFSFQGEGPLAGEPFLFVRTAACPLRCTYCDTPQSYDEPPGFELRDFGGRASARLPNPVEAGDLVEALPAETPKLVRWVSLTGGEPLLQADFGRGLFEILKGRGLRTFLDTAALDARALMGLLPHLDHLSMDWKMPSTLHGGADHGERHLDCLELALHFPCEVTVKVVLVPGHPKEEWKDLLARLHPFLGSFLLLLQPVTPCLEVEEPLPVALLLARAREALERGFRLRVLPQVHKALGLP